MSPVMGTTADMATARSKSMGIMARMTLSRECENIFSPPRAARWSVAPSLLRYPLRLLASQRSECGLESLFCRSRQIGQLLLGDGINDRKHGVRIKDAHHDRAINFT